MICQTYDMEFAASKKVSMKIIICEYFREEKIKL